MQITPGNSQIKWEICISSKNMFKSTQEIRIYQWEIDKSIKFMLRNPRTGSKNGRASTHKTPNCPFLLAKWPFPILYCINENHLSRYFYDRLSSFKRRSYFFLLMLLPYALYSTSTDLDKTTTFARHIFFNMKIQ